MSKKPKKVEQTQEQPQGEQINNIVVTVVISPSKDGDANVSHNVLVNGKAAEGIQVGLVLGGKLALTATAGVENTDQIREMAAGARGLADGLNDRIIGILLALASQQAKAANDGKTDEVLTPPPPPLGEGDKLAQTA